MGTSTDAYLFYGYCWDEEGVELPDMEELTDTRARQLAPSPWDDWVPQLSGENYEARQARLKAWMADNDVALKAWWAAKKQVTDAFTCELGRHCSGDFPMPLIAVKDSFQRAWRGSPQELDLHALSHEQHNEHWSGLLEEFVTELGLDVSEARGPGWFLASMWN